MLNGAPTVAEPVRVDVLVFWTVKVRSAVLLMATLPKLVAPAGVTLKSASATPLAVGEHELSLPDVSTAVIRAKYEVPAARPVIRADTACPEAGDVVADCTE
jgi:hypothetical protein